MKNANLEVSGSGSGGNIFKLHWDTYFDCDNTIVLLISFHNGEKRFTPTYFQKKNQYQLEQAQKDSEYVKSYRVKSGVVCQDIINYCEELAKYSYKLLFNNCQTSANDLQKKFEG